MKQSAPIRCTNCGQTVMARIETVIDAQRNPQAKRQLMSGQLNVIQCPHCNGINHVKTPLLYHDGSQDFLLAYVPQELGIKSGEEEERAIGDMMNQLANSIPKEEFKAYMFNPKRAFSYDGFMNQILEADGITPEMMEEQKQRVNLFQQLLDASDEQVDTLIRENNDQLDASFFQTFALMSNRLAQLQPQLTDKIVHIEERLLELSTYGKELQTAQENQVKVIEEVSQKVTALGENASRQDFLNLAVEYADRDEYLQALIGLIRPAFDYQFFQEMTVAIGKAPAQERESLEQLRERLLELTQMIDQQSEAVMQHAVDLLQMLLDSDDVDSLIETNLGRIDDNFMMILTGNIQEAERRNDEQTLTKLKSIYEKVVAVLQQHMQSELRFVNDLLSEESETTIKEAIAEQAPSYGDDLLEIIDAVEDVLRSRGQQGALSRLQLIREETTRVLS